MMQIVVWITTLVFMALMAGVFGWVAWSSREKSDYQPIVKKWYKTRKFYGIGLVILMAIVTIYTLRELPYNAPAYEAGEKPTIVDVEAVQFGFNMDKTEFEVGEPIEFDVTSGDVNHGFGIYDEEMNLIEQTQAMPDYTNTVYITFEEPGTYTVLCLEYCGVAHHLMKEELIVK